MARQLPAVLVVGAGELGSAVAHRLVRSGMTVVVADLRHPKCVRTAVCFAAALRLGRVEVEGVTAVRADAAPGAHAGELPVVVLGDGEPDWTALVTRSSADVLVDARMLKRNQARIKGLAGLTVGLGPGFTAGDEVDVVIETSRGPDLGRVIHVGAAEADTGVPAPVAGYAAERVVRAPLAGIFTAQRKVGDMVEVGSVLGTIAQAGEKGTVPFSPFSVVAPIGGLLRGLVMDGTPVGEGQKIGDIDPRGRRIDASKISDKGRAVAGGVLEAIMHWWAGTHD